MSCTQPASMAKGRLNCCQVKGCRDWDYVEENIGYSESGFGNGVGPRGKRCNLSEMLNHGARVNRVKRES